MWITLFHSEEGLEVEHGSCVCMDFVVRTAVRKEAGKGNGKKSRTKQLYLHGHNNFDWYVQLPSVKMCPFPVLELVKFPVQFIKHFIIIPVLFCKYETKSQQKNLVKACTS